jgi:hypothetical protein
MDELEPTKEKKLDPVGLQMYGETFTGFQRIAECNDLIPSFKDWYYQEKVLNPNATLRHIITSFNEKVSVPMGRKFHPQLGAVRQWRKKWDLDLMQKLRGTEIVTTEKKQIQQLIKTRNEQGDIVMGGADDNSLEAGVRTLGGELINDAAQMLRDDQELEEIYDEETLIKRRNYIVNVFAHTTRLVHGKAALMLKASEEKRNTAGFLMSLLAKATAGKMSDEEMALLKTAYVPHTPTPVSTPVQAVPNGNE